jgi:single-strand DNA-binding protein
MALIPKINQVALTGRLTDSPEYRLMGSGASRLTFRIAVEFEAIDRYGAQRRTETSYFQICVWARLAEALADSIDKGTDVYVTGRLRSWNFRDEQETDRANVRVEILAKHIEVLSDPKETDAPA